MLPGEETGRLRNVHVLCPGMRFTGCRSCQKLWRHGCKLQDRRLQGCHKHRLALWSAQTRVQERPTECLQAPR